MANQQDADLIKRLREWKRGTGEDLMVEAAAALEASEDRASNLAGELTIMGQMLRDLEAQLGDLQGAMSRRGTEIDQLRATVPRQDTDGDDRETLGEVLALVDDYDGCHERIRKWERLPDWEKKAHPEEEPHSDREDAEFWNRRADAALAWFSRHSEDTSTETAVRDSREADALPLGALVEARWLEAGPAVYQRVEYGLFRAVGATHGKSSAQFHYPIRVLWLPVTEEGKSE